MVGKLSGGHLSILDRESIVHVILGPREVV
jgi:hypothetical protein